MMRAGLLMTLLTAIPFAAAAQDTPINLTVRCTLTRHCTAETCTEIRTPISFGLFHTQPEDRFGEGTRLAAVRFDWRGASVIDYANLYRDNAFQIMIRPGTPGAPFIAIFAQPDGPVRIAELESPAGTDGVVPGMTFGTCGGGIA